VFFILSKTVGLLAKPFSWLVILLLTAVFTRKPKAKKISLIAALCLLLVFSNPWLTDFTLKKWEPAPVPVASLRTYDVGIVLGGFSGYYPEYDRVELTEAGDRIWQTLYLYQQGKIRNILISGGSGIKDRRGEACFMRDALLAAGIPDSVILVEDKSRNTAENALYSKTLIDSAVPGADCLLITSALHIPRALACFRKAGIQADTFPADHLAYSDRRFFEWFTPQSECLKFWDRIFNEWAGMFAYKLRGYI
jgi:uncharacterized SAM-binding protein YcdF (DUF218 family)